MRESTINKTLLTTTNEVTELDRIILSMTSPSAEIVLSKKEAEIKQRLEYAYDHLQEYTDVEVRNMLKTKFGISQSTAYTDIDNAYLVHGKTGKLRRDIEIYFLTQNGRLAIRNAIESKNNLQLIKAIEAMASVLKLIKEEELVDWNKIQPNNYFMIINQVKGDEKKTIQIDLNRVHELPAKDFEILRDQLSDSFSEERIKILEEYNHGDSKAGE